MKLKKMVSLVLTGVMAIGLLGGCGMGGGGASESQLQTSQGTGEEKAQSSQAEGAGLSEDEQVTLHLFGPGLLSTVGENGSMDLISGLELPGYKVVVDRWNELHPNVKLVIEAQPWDNWQAAIQTAVLSGDVDIIMHGASLADLDEPLDPYLEKEPELLDKVYTVAQRRTDATGDMSVMTTTGMSYVMNPMMCILDKQIFDHYGLELPDASWTWEDLVELGKKMTGTDPVTGTPTWGIRMTQTDSVGNRYFNYQLIASAYDAKAFFYGKTLQECSADLTGEKTTRVFQTIQDISECLSPDVREGINVSKTITDENAFAIQWEQDPFTRYNEIKACGGEERFVLMTMPAIEEGDLKGKPSLFMGDHNMSICNTSKNKEWAWEFLKFMVTDEVVTEWVIGCMQLPNNREGMERVKERMGENFSAPMVQALEQSPVGFSNSTNDYFNNVSFGSVTADTGNAIGEILMGNMKPEEAGPYIQKNIDEYLQSKK